MFPKCSLIVDQVLRGGNMEASLRRLTHELELYKQGMSALMSLVPYTQNADDGQKQSRFTVNSFLLRNTRSDALWLETSPPQSPERKPS
jgi:hypothetical protein